MNILWSKCETGNRCIIFLLSFGEAIIYLTFLERKLDLIRICVVRSASSTYLSSSLTNN